MQKNIFLLLNYEKINNFSERFSQLIDEITEDFIEKNGNNKDILDDIEELSSKIEKFGFTIDELEYYKTSIDILGKNIDFLEENKYLIEENKKGFINTEEYKKLQKMQNLIDGLNLKNNEGKMIFDPNHLGKIFCAKEFFTEYKNISKEKKIQPYIDFIDKFIEVEKKAQKISNNKEYTIETIKTPLPNIIVKILRLMENILSKTDTIINALMNSIKNKSISKNLITKNISDVQKNQTNQI